MNSINFYPDDDTYLYYIDNIKLSEIPAETYQYCYTVPLMPACVNTTPEIVCWGGGYDRNASGTVGESGYWFRYVVRRAVFFPLHPVEMHWTAAAGYSGEDCHYLVILGVNDDQCLSVMAMITLPTVRLW